MYLPSTKLITPLECWLISNSTHVGVRSQVATIEQASVEGSKIVEAPVVVVTGASRGIGKAIALSLGKAGCKVRNSSWFCIWNVYIDVHIPFSFCAVELIIVTSVTLLLWWLWSNQIVLYPKCLHGFQYSFLILCCRVGHSNQCQTYIVMFTE